MEKVDKFLSVLGIEVADSNSKDYLVNVCPLCNGNGKKFAVKIETGQYGCRRCGSKGNSYTLFRQLYDSAPYIDVVPPYLEAKGISLDTCIDWGVAIVNEKVVIPSRDPEGKITNLYRLTRTKDGHRFYGLPGIPPGMFMDSTMMEHNEVYTLEGPADGMLLSQLYQGEENISVCAVPGANIFPERWGQWYDGKESCFIYDNDHTKELTDGNTFHPGWDGMIRAASRSQGDSLIMQWGDDMEYDPELDDGYDFGDLMTEHGFEEGWSILESRLIQPPTVDVKTTGKIACNDFTKLIGEFSKHLYMPDSYRSTLACMIASIISVKLKAEPIWFRVFGPPGSGKTTLAESLGYDRERVVMRSVLTGFHSGIGAGDEDASVIQTINNRTLIVKDADTVLSSPNYRQILAELRDIFDGTSNAQYRTGLIKEYSDLNVSFILCGTDKLRTMDKSSLGERFMNVEILSDSQSRKPFIDFAFSNTLSRMDDASTGTMDANTLTLARMSKGFLDYVDNKPKKIPTFSPRVQKTIKAFAQIVALLRSDIDEDDDTARPRSETATRLVSQFTKLAAVLSWIVAPNEIDQMVMKCLHHVFSSTIYGYRREIVEDLYNFEQSTANKVAMRINTTRPTVTKHNIVLQEFGILQRGSGSGKSHYWRLSPDFRRMWKMALSSPRFR